MGEHLLKERKVVQQLDQSIIEKQIEQADQRYLKEKQEKRAKMEKERRDLKQFRELHEQRKVQLKEQEGQETKQLMEQYKRENEDYQQDLCKLQIEQRKKQIAINKVNESMIVSIFNLGPTSNTCATRKGKGAK
jgi:ribosomal protein L3